MAAMLGLSQDEGPPGKATFLYSAAARRRFQPQPSVHILPTGSIQGLTFLKQHPKHVQVRPGALPGRAAAAIHDAAAGRQGAPLLRLRDVAPEAAARCQPVPWLRIRRHDLGYLGVGAG